MAEALPVENITVDLGFRAWPHQRDAFERMKGKRFSVLVWHRRAGKTLFACVLLVWVAATTAKDDARFAYIAPLRNQAKAVAWDYLKKLARKIPGTTFNETELSVTFVNGAVVRIFGADNPDALRGLYFDGCVLDELAQMKPEMWGEVMRPALADRKGWSIFIGTPKGTNLFSELYYRALKGDSVGATDDERGWHADLRRWTETSALSDGELRQMRAEMTEPQWAQEMECDFSAAVENVLLALNEVRAAQGRTVAEAHYVQHPRLLGVDVARYGGDRNVIFPRQGPVAMQPNVFGGMDLMATAGQVAQTIDRWKPHAVFVDVGGYGAGVVDRLRQLGFRVIGVDFGGKALDSRFENKRAEMWWLMADWVRSAGCLPEAQDLAVDLTGPTYSYANARGRLQLESKDELRKRGLPSPDLADALACTFAAPVPMPTLASELGLGGSSVKSDWDPLGERRLG